ncbi:MAG: AAA family ATPase [Phycisphaerales bacterium]|nr:AAA family ATPase [Phycisphaerae bacterium]NNF44390.1 AAA family ATPase [Phycisphaerales bacterium]NNM26270.1 AAA family ATPase [Phycisphaerales bacterium]
MNLLLIGARASGKTTVGRHLARISRLRFVDLDDRVQAMFPEDSVTEIWTVHGEPAWRVAETRALESVLAEEDQVVALGGGTPMIPAARSLIEHARRTGRARVLYLRCTPGELARRLEHAAGDRPSLTGDDPAAEVAAVLAARSDTYEALADVVYDGDDAAAAIARLCAEEREAEEGSGSAGRK